MQTARWFIPVLLVYLLFTFCKEKGAGPVVKGKILITHLKQLMGSTEINEADTHTLHSRIRYPGSLLSDWALQHAPKLPAFTEADLFTAIPLWSRAVSLPGMMRSMHTDGHSRSDYLLVFK